MNIQLKCLFIVQLKQSHIWQIIGAICGCGCWLLNHPHPNYDNEKESFDDCAQFCNPHSLIHVMP